MLTCGITPEFRGGVHLFNYNRHTPSGQFRVYRVTQLRTDGVHCRESTGTGPVNLKVVPNECCLGRSPWTKNIFASHSHTHYWYEVGMLKVQSIKAAEEWISMEDDQEVVEEIRLDCQYELTGEAADDGE